MAEPFESRFQNLHEFVTQARINLDRNNWDYLIGGSETETTLARNRLALDAIAFRPRVLRDVSNVDCSSTLFGKKLRIPVLCAPVGSLEVFEPGGGATVAEATRAFGNGIILSSVSHPGLDKTAEASGDGFKIFQLYVRGDAAWVDDHVCRAIDKSYDAFCLTVDTDSYSRRERDIAKRHQRRRVRVASATVAPPPGSNTSSDPTGAHKTGMRSFLPNSELLQSTFDTSRNTRGRKPIASSASRLRARVVSVSEPPIR